MTRQGVKSVVAVAGFVCMGAFVDRLDPSRPSASEPRAAQQMVLVRPVSAEVPIEMKATMRLAPLSAIAGDPGVSRVVRFQTDYETGRTTVIRTDIISRT